MSGRDRGKGINYHDVLVGLFGELEESVALLRTVWAALGNPEMNDQYGPESTRRALEIATDNLSRARDNAAEASDQIWYDRAES